MNMMGMMQNMLFSQLQSNPMFRQAQEMCAGKSPEEIKQTCENLCKSYGISFDDAWNRFQSQFPGLR